MKLIFITFFTSMLFSKTLIFFCGITMSKAMAEISQKYERIYNTKVIIIPGGSKSLLKTIKNSKKGDLYLPGSEIYIKNNKDLFEKYSYIGYNILALIVKKGNPKNITSLNDLTKKNIKVVLCNYKLSSCGKETKKVLKNKFWTVYDKAIDIALDSAPLNQMIKTYADVGPNWKATITFNRDELEAVDIKTAKKHPLYLAVLKFSKRKKEAINFLNFVLQNKNILVKYGFRDETEK